MTVPVSERSFIFTKIKSEKAQKHKVKKHKVAEMWAELSKALIIQ